MEIISQEQDVVLKKMWICKRIKEELNIFKRAYLKLKSINKLNDRIDEDELGENVIRTQNTQKVVKNIEVNVRHEL